MQPDTVLVPVQILNSEYNIRCPSDQLDSLLEASRYLNEKMQKTRDETESISVDRIAIITALNIAGEHLKTNEELTKKKKELFNISKNLEERIEKIKDRIDDTLDSKE